MICELQHSWNTEQPRRGALPSAIRGSDLRIAIRRSLPRPGPSSPHGRATPRLVRLLGALVVLVALAGGCTGTHEAAVQVTDARIRAVVPGQDKTAAYLNITNRGATPFVLTGIESTQARAIEIHVIERDGDDVRMRRIPELAVEPGATVRLEPGGLHLMIFGVSGPAERFTATLLAADGTRIDVPFALIALGGN
jgi:copper(I)-binding protein